MFREVVQSGVQTRVDGLSATSILTQAPGDTAGPVFAGQGPLRRDADGTPYSRHRASALFSSPENEA